MGGIKKGTVRRISRRRREELRNARATKYSRVDER